MGTSQAFERQGRLLLKEEFKTRHDKTKRGPLENVNLNNKLFKMTRD